MTKFKSIFTGLALLLASTVIALLAVELGMRALGISFPVFDTYDAVRGIALRPGKTGLYNKEGRAYLSINREGYRDINHEIAKPTGVFRIAVLGDSFTEARQMPLEQAYWARLGVELQDCPAVAGRDIEMLNFGIGGYETSHALLTLEKDVFKLNLNSKFNSKVGRFKRPRKRLAFSSQAL